MKRLQISRRVTAPTAGDKATGLDMQAITISAEDKAAAERLVRRLLHTDEHVDTVLDALGLAS